MGAGIDYGAGIANRNMETGIHYGVISIHRLPGWFSEELEHHYGEPSCPNCGGEVSDSDKMDDENAPSWFDGKDWHCLACKKCYWNDTLFSGPPIAYSYDRDGLKLYMGGDDIDVFVIESPYYTYAAYCGPCAPGAGDLSSPRSDGVGVKTYCLGQECFDSDDCDPCPYSIYQVSDNKCIYRPNEC